MMFFPIHGGHFVRHKLMVRLLVQCKRGWRKEGLHRHAPTSGVAPQRVPGCMSTGGACATSSAAVGVFPPASWCWRARVASRALIVATVWCHGVSVHLFPLLQCRLYDGCSITSRWGSLARGECTCKLSSRLSLPMDGHYKFKLA